MCRVYGVTRAGYYAWRERPVSARVQQDEKLKPQIERVYKASGKTYGSPRVYRELRKAGVAVGENRIARLMRVHGIKARAALRSYYRVNMKRFYAAVPNRTRGLKLCRADQVWVGDINT